VQARRCLSCPAGFNCSMLGSDTFSALVATGYWRPYRNATTAKPCPIEATCVGQDVAGNTLCQADFENTYCSRCSAPDHYLEPLSIECRSCRQARSAVGAALLSTLAALLAVVLVAGWLQLVAGWMSTRRSPREPTHQRTLRSRIGMVCARLLPVWWRACAASPESLAAWAGHMPTGCSVQLDRRTWAPT
jgi:hypothetical protein